MLISFALSFFGLISIPAFSQVDPGLFKALGIQSLHSEQISETERSVVVSAIPVVVNDETINLDNEKFSVSIQKNISIIEYRSTAENYFQLYYDGSDISMKYNQEERVMDEKTIEQLNESGKIAFIILSAILSEIKNSFDQTDFDYPQSKMATVSGCQLSQISIGGGRSTTDGRCKKRTATFLTSHADCTQSGGCDTSCLFDNHACFATAFYYCTGNSCESTPEDYSCWSCLFPWI